MLLGRDPCARALIDASAKIMVQMTNEIPLKMLFIICSGNYDYSTLLLHNTNDGFKFFME
jgi:hypothetical protein